MDEERVNRVEDFVRRQRVEDFASKETETLKRPAKTYTGKLADLDPEFAPLVEQFQNNLRSKGIETEVRSGKRTRAQQEALYNNRANNPLPVAKPGSSKHEIGRAVDIVPVGKRDNKIWETMAVEAEKLGLGAGWRFKGKRDPVHFYFNKTNTLPRSVDDVKTKTDEAKTTPSPPLPPLPPLRRPVLPEPNATQLDENLRPASSSEEEVKQGQANEKKRLNEIKNFGKKIKGLKIKTDDVETLYYSYKAGEPDTVKFIRERENEFASYRKQVLAARASAKTRAQVQAAAELGTREETEANIENLRQRVVTTKKAFDDFLKRNIYIPSDAERLYKNQMGSDPNSTNRWKQSEFNRLKTAFENANDNFQKILGGKEKLQKRIKELEFEFSKQGPRNPLKEVQYQALRQVAELPTGKFESLGDSLSQSERQRKAYIVSLLEKGVNERGLKLLGSERYKFQNELEQIAQKEALAKTDANQPLPAFNPNAPIESIMDPRATNAGLTMDDIQTMKANRTNIEKMGTVRRVIGQQAPRIISKWAGMTSNIFRGFGIPAKETLRKEIVDYFDSRAIVYGDAANYRPEDEGVVTRIARGVTEGIYDIGELMTVSKLTGASLPTVMGGEAFVSNMNRGAGTATKEAAKAYILGKVFEFAPAIPLGKSKAGQVVGQHLGSGFTGAVVSAASTKFFDPNATPEQILEEAAKGFVLALPFKGQRFRDMAEVYATKLIQSGAVRSERAMDFVAPIARYGKAVFVADDGRVMVAYGKRGDKLAREVKPEEAKTYDVGTEKGYVLPVTAAEYEALARSFGVQTRGSVPQISEGKQTTSAQKGFKSDDEIPTPKADESVTPPPARESNATLKAQLDEVVNPESSRVAVLFTRGEARPKRPIGVFIQRTKEGVLYINAKKLNEQFGLRTQREFDEFINEYGIEPLIGKVEPVSDTSKGLALRTEDAETGSELSTSIVTSPETAEIQAAEDVAQFPDKEIVQEILPAQEAVQKRIDEVTQEEEEEESPKSQVPSPKSESKSAINVGDVVRERKTDGRILEVRNVTDQSIELGERGGVGDPKVFSSSNGEITEIPLSGKIKESVADSSVSNEATKPATDTETQDIDVSKEQNNAESQSDNAEQPLANVKTQVANVKTQEDYAVKEQNNASRETLEKPAKVVEASESILDNPPQTVKTERGSVVTIHPTVIEANDVLTSLEENYPSEFQPRDRSRIASKEQISRIANNLEPSFLDDSPKASDGRPLVVPVEMPDGKTKYAVISGNGRSAAIKEAYNLSESKFGKYKEFALSKTDKDFSEPVYVGVINTEGIDLKTLASEANETGVARMSAVEQAQSDAKAISSNLMEKFYPTEDGEINTPANREFIKEFVMNVAGDAERGALLTGDGRLSIDGINRVRNAVFAKAYAETAEGLQALSKLAEDPDNNVRLLTTAMLHKASRFVKLKELISKGQAYPVDISGDIAAAVSKMSVLREEGSPVETYLRQGALFGHDLTIRQKRLLATFDEHKRSSRTINAILDNYLRAAELAGDPSQAGMFQAFNLLPSIDPLLDAAVKEAIEGNGEQTSLFGETKSKDDTPIWATDIRATTEPQVPTGSGGMAKPDETAKPAESKRETPKRTKSEIDKKPIIEFSTTEKQEEVEKKKDIKVFAKEQRDLLSDKNLSVGDVVELEAPVAGGLGGTQVYKGIVEQDKGGNVFVRTSDGNLFDAFENDWKKTLDDGGMLTKENDDAKRKRDNLEPDSRLGRPENGVRTEVLPAQSGPVDRSDAEGGGHTATESKPAGDKRVSDDSSPTGRERSDSELSSKESSMGTRAAGSEQSRGSVDIGEPRVPSGHIPPERVEEASAKQSTLEEKRRLQRSAQSVEVKQTDLENIRASLPFLLPEQQNDVQFAETRLSKPDGYGVLFTNGTGTGKTYTGLGVVKRFERTGKTNIIIVAPNDKIIEDWIDSGKNLLLNLKKLKDTDDNGRDGIVITTYSNFGQNKTLADRDWDLIVTDESHYLSSAESGKLTEAGETLRAISFHPEGSYSRARMLLRELDARIDEKRAQRNNHKPDTPQYKKLDNELGDLVKEYNERSQPIKDAVKSIQPQARPRVVMLSATPFAYVKSIEYANGYLFDYSEGKPKDTGGRSYNEGSNREQFFMQHFGYRMRYNKLTRPDAAVNNSLMERQFNEHLKKQGSLSGRALEVEKDYDRKFIMVSDAIGAKIDDGLDFLMRADKGKFNPLWEQLKENFKYHNRLFLLEALKAKHLIPIIKKNLELGRKVVVFHDFIKGGGFHPFKFSKRGGVISGYDEAGKLTETNYNDLVAEFESRRPDLVNLDLSGLHSPIITLKRAFPNILLFNGTIAKGEKLQNVKTFNGDESGRNLILVQSDAGREGISLHDTTGRHPRVLFNLGLPIRPTASVQIEGRIYRTGQESDAVIRYLNTGTNFERWTFASKIAERASTAENLALGDTARALKESFIDSFETAEHNYEPNLDEGKGGKAKDRESIQIVSEFERAKSFYFGQQKKTSRNKSREGIDYFATPEPLGYKMVEWAGVHPGESVLEPSAGHGAIARFFPESSSATIIEPSFERGTRASLVSNAKLVVDRFEDHHIVNKYDAIVMNPPFGKGGKTAIEHLEKATKHLRDGGRVVALIPEGPAADKRLHEFLYGEKSAKDIFKIADIHLPSVTFERAGTSVRAHIIILEKQTDPKVAARLRQVERDYSDAKTINEFFDSIEDAAVPERINRFSNQEVEKAEDRNITETVLSKGDDYELGQFRHTKTGEEIFAASPKGYLGDDWNKIKAAAKKHGGWYSRYKGEGAIAGFLFKTKDARDKFLTEIGADSVSDNEMVNDGDNIPQNSQDVNDIMAEGRTGLEEEFTELNAGFPFLKALFGDRFRDDSIGSPDMLKEDIDEIEERLTDSEGIKRENILKRALEGSKEIVRSFKRTFQHLDPNKSETNAITNDLLRQHLAVPEWSKALAADKIAEITQNLGPNRLKLFTRSLVLPDILKDVEAGLYDDPDSPTDYREMPFGFQDRADLESSIARYESLVNATPAVKDAIDRRQKFVKSLTQKLVDLELLSPEVLKDSRYYHRQVMEHVNNPSFVGTGSDVRLKRKGFQRGRTGGGDFNTRYQEAEFEWVSQALALIARKETLKRIKEAADVKPQLERKADTINRIQLNTIPDAMDAYKEYNKKIAVASRQLRAMAKGGTLTSQNNIFDSLINQLANAPQKQKFNHPDWFKFLAHISSNNLPGAVQANTIFSALKDREALLKDALGNDFKTWEDFIPEDHEIWQPEKGNFFYPATSIAERTLDDLLLSGRSLEESDLRQILSVGGKKEQWVIPSDIAQTLNEFEPYQVTHPIENLWTSAQSTWKQWVLINPVRVLKYNLNNLSGDLDIALAYDPTILKHYRKAAVDLWRYQVSGKANDAIKTEMQDALKKGVIGSGLTIAEISDINQVGAFKVLLSEQPNIIQRGIEKFWNASKTFTNWRENILRLAAYRYFKEQIAKGNSVYGASTKPQIDTIKDPDEKAAKLARELIGDYGAVSHAGRWIRRHLIPFYSWIEVNAPRYARLLRNLPHEGRTGGKKRVASAVAAKSLFGFGKLFVKANLLFLLASLYNRFVHPEEEKQLRKEGRQNHIILGKRNDGSIRTIRVEGALADALEWFALDDYPSDIADLVKGEATWKDKLAEGAKAPVNRLVNSWEPVSKTTFELVLGRTAYPSVFGSKTDFRLRGRVVRDRGEYAARLFSMDGLYRRITGRPKPPSESGVGQFLDWTVAMRTNPDEAAYFEARGNVADWAKTKGKETSAVDPTEKSNALYYYKQALKWGDKEAADRWLKKYMDLGGTEKGIEQSVKAGHPLGGLAKKHWKEYIDSLTPERRAELEAAIKYYSELNGKEYKGIPKNLDEAEESAKEVKLKEDKKLARQKADADIPMPESVKREFETLGINPIRPVAIRIKGKIVSLTPEQEEKLRSEILKNTYPRIEKIINLPVYQKMKPEQKKKRIQAIIRTANDLPVNKMRREMLQEKRGN